MEVTEIIEVIKVGFNKPKFYKRSVWNKAVKVMEYLVDHTTEVVRINMGAGLEKYKPLTVLTEDKLYSWALAYVNNKK